MPLWENTYQAHSGAESKTRMPVYPAKVTRSGNSLVISLPRPIRKELGLMHGDVIACRVLHLQGHVYVVAEKLSLNKAADLASVATFLDGEGENRG